MFVLDTTTRTLEVLLDAAPATNQLPVVVTYADVNFAGASPHTLASSNTQTNGTTAVTAAAAPAAGVKRQVEELTVRNDDTAARTVTLRYNDNGTFRKILTPTLQPGEALEYTHAAGLRTLAADGSLKVTWSAPSISQGGAFVRANLDGSLEASPAAGKNLTLDSGDLVLPAAGRLGWSTDAFLRRDGAGLLSQRDGTGAQALRVYNTFADASNGEWGAARWNSNVLELGAYANGTGTARNVKIVGGATVQVGDGVGTSVVRLYAPSVEVRVSGTAANQNLTNSYYDNNDGTLKGRLIYAGANVAGSRYFGFINDAADALNFFTLNATPIGLWTNGALAWQVTGSGHFTAGSDNTYDLGAAGASRPRNGYFAGGVAVLVKAGTPADADFTNPVNGMIAVDSSANKIWVRLSGVWKGVAVA